MSVLGADPASGTRAQESRPGFVRPDESAPAGLTLREAVRHRAHDRPGPRDPEQVITLAGPEAEADGRIRPLSDGRRRLDDPGAGQLRWFFS
ncbi:hypothetical protein ACIQVL_24590 [Streptomyces sp. NPDC090499]|uniref:hypothetical protein n=1 Tax=Streptomyces sp. NPDC090499 TaxID=3365965 RepID=UPI00381C288A